MFLIHEQPEAIVSALDTVLGAQGYQRLAAETIHEDFSPLLANRADRWRSVIAPARRCTACFTSLALDPEWDLADTRAGLEVPVVYALFDGERDIYLYRYFEDGDLREEALSEALAPRSTSPACWQSCRARYRRHPRRRSRGWLRAGASRGRLYEYTIGAIDG